MQWERRINTDTAPERVYTKVMTIKNKQVPVLKQVTTVDQPIGPERIKLSIYWSSKYYYFPWVEIKPHLGGKVTEAQVRDLIGVRSWWILPNNIVKPRSRLMIPCYSLDQILLLAERRQTQLYLNNVKVESKIEVNRKFAQMEAMLSDDSRDSSEDYEDDGFVCADDEVESLSSEDLSDLDVVYQTSEEDDDLEQFIQQKKRSWPDEQTKMRKMARVISDD